MCNNTTTNNNNDNKCNNNSNSNSNNTSNNKQKPACWAVFQALLRPRFLNAAMLQTESSQTDILRAEFPGELPMFWRILRLSHKILIESILWACRMSVRETSMPHHIQLAAASEASAAYTPVQNNDTTNN